MPAPETLYSLHLPAQMLVPLVSRAARCADAEAFETYIDSTWFGDNFHALRSQTRESDTYELLALLDPVTWFDYLREQGTDHGGLTASSLSDNLNDVVEFVYLTLTGCANVAEKFFVPSKWLEVGQEEAMEGYQQFMEAWKKVDTDREKSISAEDVMKAYEANKLTRDLMDLIRWWKESDAIDKDEWEEESTMALGDPPDEYATPESWRGGHEFLRKMIAQELSHAIRFRSDLLAQLKGSLTRSNTLNCETFVSVVKPKVTAFVRTSMDAHFNMFALGFADDCPAADRCVLVALANLVKTELEKPNATDELVDGFCCQLFKLLDTKGTDEVTSARIDALFTMMHVPGGATGQERVKAAITILASAGDDRVTVADLTAFGDKLAGAAFDLIRKLLDVANTAVKGLIETMAERVVDELGEGEGYVTLMQARLALSDDKRFFKRIVEAVSGAAVGEDFRDRFSKNDIPRMAGSFAQALN